MGNETGHHAGARYRFSGSTRRLILLLAADEFLTVADSTLAALLTFFHGGGRGVGGISAAMRTAQRVEDSYQQVRRQMNRLAEQAQMEGGGERLGGPRPLNPYPEIRSSLARPTVTGI